MILFTQSLRFMQRFESKSDFVLNMPGFHMIIDHRRILGSAICDHMETRICDRLRSPGIIVIHMETQLRSIAIETYPIILTVDPIIQHSIATAPCLC